jgi:HK97 family phage portal protein
LKAIFTNDTSVKGLGLYSNESLDDGAKEIQRKFRSGDDIVSVPGDGKLYPLSMTSSDMEILGNKKFGIREICRAFRVPPSKIYDDYNHAYNAGETENVGFLTDSIDALLTKIEQEITVKLLGDSPVVLSNYLISFDREKMFTVNSITKADFYTKMLATGVWGVNDIRRKENMPAVEGGDVALISCNVAPLNSTKITGEEKSGQPLLEKNTKE